mmetsp:Transcript_1105/g.2562  ORF Transcript_1105/g.2562 Transcript_1105/m.2562 type:complete len:298 (+) Transcript_1105:3-896(+)
MGRAGEKRRRQKEKKQKLEEDVAEILKVKTPTEQISQLPDDQLFFIDEKRDEAGLSGLKRSKRNAGKTQAAAVKSTGNRKAQPFTRKPESASEKKTPKAEKEGQVYDLWGDSSARKASSKKQYRVNTFVEPPGCSYNPEYEVHQDAVAEIVAADRQESLANKVNQLVSQEEGGPAPVAGKGNQKIRKPSDVPDQRFVSVKKTLKQIRREERARDEQLERKRQDQEDRKKVLPPRLGKRKFVPELSKVLPTQEIDGSLMNLKSTPGLASSVFNKLQKRGLIEVREEAQKRRRRRFIRR